MKIREVKKSISYAWRGLAYVFRHEQNFRIQLVFGLLVILAMFFFGLRRSEMVVILLLILLVLILEVLNSALEMFVDILKPRLHEQVGVVKNIMAAMVLCAAIGSFVIGGIIFYPYLFSF